MQDLIPTSRLVRNAVSDKVSLLAIDEAAGYQKLHQALPHQHVDHKAHENVRGEVHTNNLESFWSLLKRGVIGTYHNVSKKYLPLYVNGFSSATITARIQISSGQR
jgi:hypothetical protein